MSATAMDSSHTICLLSFTVISISTHSSVIILSPPHSFTSVNHGSLRTKASSCFLSSQCNTKQRLCHGSSTHRLSHKGRSQQRARARGNQEQRRWILERMSRWALLLLLSGHVLLMGLQIQFDSFVCLIFILGCNKEMAVC